MVGRGLKIERPKNWQRYHYLKTLLRDAFLQQILMHPADYSDHCDIKLKRWLYFRCFWRLKMGGIGIAPGANIWWGGASVSMKQRTVQPQIYRQD